MDLRQLSHFVAVAEDESFTRAAQRMNIVQSGISHSIASLERDLGVQLFRRSKHHVQLTAAGHALLLEALESLVERRLIEPDEAYRHAGDKPALANAFRRKGIPLLGVDPGSESMRPSLRISAG